MITNCSEHDIGKKLEEYFTDTKQPVFIMSPFIENKTILKVLSKIKTRNVSIVTSWNAKHLKDGVSSLELYAITKSNGWTLYINNNLHAKIYSLSFNSCFIGSMNCTNKALYDKNGNIECYHYRNKMEVGDRIELTKIINTSTLVDDRIYAQYRLWYDSIVLNDTSDEIDNLVINDFSPFYVFQLPIIEHPIQLYDYIIDPDKYANKSNEFEHDLGIYSSGSLNYLSKDEFIEDLKYHYISHPFIKKIDELITPEGTRFGEFRMKIREICSDVPVPYKCIIDECIHHIYTWFTDLFPEKYYTNTPRHSEILYRKR